MSVLPAQPDGNSSRSGGDLAKVSQLLRLAPHKEHSLLVGVLEDPDSFRKVWQHMQFAFGSVQLDDTGECFREPNGDVACG